MTKIKHQNKQFIPELGDISPFVDSKFLFEIKEWDRDKNLNNLMSLGNGTPFSVLMDLGIDIGPLRQKYTCPHTGMDFFSLVPMYIMSNNIQKYREKQFSDMVLDSEWNWMQDFDDKTNKPYYDKIYKSMIGTGYTAYTSSWDGSNSEEIVGVELDNGDILVCLTWQWYNK